MSSIIKTFTCKLDGMQSLSIPIELKKYGRYIIDPVEIIVNGYLKFESGPSSQPIVSSPYESVDYQQGNSNTIEDKTIIYPVLFSNRRMTIYNGKGVLTLIPRSEDVLQDLDEVQARAEGAWVSDNDITEGNVPAVSSQITEEKDNRSTIVVETGTIREPYKISIEISIVDGFYYGRTVDIPYSVSTTEVPKESTTGNTTGGHYYKDSPKNGMVDYYNDIDWLPYVENILETNQSSFQTMWDEIDNLRYSTPFGASPLSDALNSAAIVFSDNTIDEKPKTIYLFTDNDANTSKLTLDQAIEAVNNIDGSKKVPVLCGNFSIVDPFVLSVKANVTDTSSLNKISFLTGGQSLTLVTEDDIDYVAGIFYGQGVGALGYGVFQFTVDLGEIAYLNSIVAEFDLSIITAKVNWNISISSDGYNFTAIEEIYLYNQTAEFENIFARYIRFNIIFITTFDNSYDEYLPSAILPYLKSITISYNEIKKAYLYLKPETTQDAAPYQMSLAVDATDIDPDQIQVGVATSDSHNWTDYSTDSKPHIDQNGKVVVPIRYSSPTDVFQKETLDKVDDFTLKSLYGQWDPYANVTIYDENDKIVSSSKYSAFPREGLVVFNYMLDPNYEEGDYKINVLNQNKYKIGLELENKYVDNPLSVYGIGNLYTTGKDLLPPVSKLLPEARNLLASPSDAETYTPIQVSYDFYDVNYDQEDTSKTRIKWYINDEYISFLDNLTKWNDTSNPGDPLYTQAFTFTYSQLSEGEDPIDKARENLESILHINDRIYCTVQVSDGNIYGEITKSNVLKIIETEPFVAQLFVKALKADGSIVDRLSADIGAVIYPDLTSSFYSDTNVNNSEIIWYVNGDEFKRGIYGYVSEEGHRIDRILSGETSGETLQNGLAMLNEIVVQVVPKSEFAIGDAVTSQAVIVENSLPSVSSVQLLPTYPNENQNLVLIWEFFDFEINTIPDESQSDETSVKWFRKTIYSGVFEEVGEVTNILIPTGISMEKTAGGTDTVIVDASLTSVGDQWYAVISPNDSLDSGESYQTSIVTIKSAS